MRRMEDSRKSIGKDRARGLYHPIALPHAEHGGRLRCRWHGRSIINDVEKSAPQKNDCRRDDLKRNKCRSLRASLSEAKAACSGKPCRREDVIRLGPQPRQCQIGATGSPSPILSASRFTAGHAYQAIRKRRDKKQAIFTTPNTLIAARSNLSIVKIPTAGQAVGATFAGSLRHGGCFCQLRQNRSAISIETCGDA
jgi:hypothetical protein